MNSSAPPDFDFGGARIWDWCPDIAVLFGLVTVLFVANRPWRLFARGTPAAEIDRLARALFAWIVGGGVLAATRNILLPRYLTLAVPFVILQLTLCSPRRIGPVPLRTLALASLLVFQWSNRQGRFYPSLESDRLRHFGRISAFLERSHEYRRDLAGQRAAAAWLADRAPGATIVTHFPFGHFLSLPRLGYVERPLQGYCLDLDTDYIPRFRELRWFGADEATDVVFVATKPDFPHLFDPAPGDETLWDDGRPTPLRIYRKSAAALAEYKRSLGRILASARVDQARAFWQRGKIDHARPLLLEARDAWLASPEAAILAADLALVAQNRALAQTEIERAIAGPEQRWLWEPTSLDMDARREARAVVDRLIDSAPDRRDEAVLRVLRGKLLLEDKEPEAAATEFAQALALDPENPNAWFGRGIALPAESPTEKAESFAKAAELRPSFAQAHFHLGLVAFHAGRYADAARAFEQAATVAPHSAIHHFHVGAARQKLGEHVAAARAFRQSAALDPKLRDARNALAWLLATSADERVRSPAEAARLARDLCAETDNKVARYLDTLAAALAATGAFEEAVRIELEAIQWAPQDPEAFIGEYQARKERYQRGEALRE